LRGSGCAAARQAVTGLRNAKARSVAIITKTTFENIVVSFFYIYETNLSPSVIATLKNQLNNNKPQFVTSIAKPSRYELKNIK
jgi:hypothetical protein